MPDSADQELKLKPQPIPKLLTVADSMLESAQTGDQKNIALKVATVALSEIQFRRLKNMLLLLASVEESLVESIMLKDSTTDEILSLYKLLHDSSKEANKQIQDTIKSLDNSTLLNFIGGRKDSESDDIIDVSAEALATLKALSEI